MSLQEILTTTNSEISAKAVDIIKKYPSRLRYRREELKALFRKHQVGCKFSTHELKTELYKIQGYKTQVK